MKPRLKLLLSGQVIVLPASAPGASDIDRSFSRLMVAAQTPTLEALAAFLGRDLKTLRVWRCRGRIPDSAVLHVSKISGRPVAWLQALDPLAATLDWHPADVIAALRKEGLSLRQLAHANGYSHIQRVLSSPWLAAEQIVARALGCAPQEIWPSRYRDAQQRQHAYKLTRKFAIERPEATRGAP
jgi:Ner family transcriptional regulator